MTERERQIILVLSESLEAEIEARYTGIKDHPAIKPKYDRDMQEVRAAKDLLDGKTSTIT